MIAKWTKEQIMDIVNQDVVCWSALYEKIGLFDLPWGDIKPDVKYIYMSQKDQVELKKIWKSMLKTTKDKRFKAFRVPFRENVLGMDDLCYRPTYADDLGCFLLVDTENTLQRGKFDITLE